jgi:hypothetical protein
MKTIKFAILVTIIALTLSGCATHRTTTPTDPKVSLNYSPELSPVLSSRNSVTISQARVYQDGDEFIISGRVKRMHRIQLPGHIDLAICAPDGTLLTQEIVRVPSLASNRKGVLELPFRVQLQTTPPEGSKIDLKYHAPSSKEMEHGCIKS